MTPVGEESTEYVLLGLDPSGGRGMPRLLGEQEHILQPGYSLQEAVLHKGGMVPTEHCFG